VRKNKWKDFVTGTLGIAMYLFINGGAVFIVTNFDKLFLCPLTSISITSIDYTLCLRTTQQILNAFFSTYTTHPLLVSMFTGFSVTVTAGYRRFSRHNRVALLKANAKKINNE
jgi:hypothetical protein